MPHPVSRRTLAFAAGAALVAIALFVALYRPFPSDKTPEGAYLRIAKSATKSEPRAFFAYLETEAQWACYTIRDTRAKAVARIRASYPEPQRSALLAQYERFGAAPDGSDVFAIVYAERGWSTRLMKDLSGVAKVEVEGERASVVTTHGTRWPFRRRDNGIWGLTVFTAELVAESERTTRDLAVVNATADDFDRLRKP